MGIDIIDWTSATPDRRTRLLIRNQAASLLGSLELTASIQALIDDVDRRGDRALVDALERFDGVTTTELRVSEAEFDTAADSISPELSDAIDLAIGRLRAFNTAIVERSSWQMPTAGGGTVGEVTRPLESGGLFVPCGKGSFPSVLLQIGVPAVTAGVQDLQVVVPPTPGQNGSVDPATLVIARRLGISDVYRLNGPTGIAALAIGTETVRPVNIVVGPGSVPVAIAQQLIQSRGCRIVTGLGPTDSLILADDTANITMLAADVINEAEHGPDSSAVLISTSHDLLTRTAAEIERQLLALPEPRRTWARTSISANGGLVLADTWDQAIRIANDYAPEHLQIATADPHQLVEQVRFAGTVLLGQWTTFASSNFVLGTPATLPTTGHAKHASGVTAHTYLNQISIADISEDEFWTLAGAAKAFAQYEGFPAHEASVVTREQLT